MYEFQNLDELIYETESLGLQVSSLQQKVRENLLAAKATLDRINSETVEAERRDAERNASRFSNENSRLKVQAIKLVMKRERIHARLRAKGL